MKKRIFSKNFWIPACAGMTIGLSLFLTCPSKADGEVTVRLQIKTNDASLYDADIAVTACADSPTASTTSVNAKCAVDQVVLGQGWAATSTWYSFGVMLNSINQYDGSDGNYWQWFGKWRFRNLEYGPVALNAHVFLTDGEKLLLVYGVNPLRISVDNASPFVNATTTIKVEQFGLDASWSPAWTLAASSTLVIDGSEVENSSGNYEYIATTTGVRVVYGKKSGYLDSENLTITVQAVPAAEQPVAPRGGSVIIIPAAGGGGSVPAATSKIDLAKAADFLMAKQNADGSYNSALLTDWAALAIASVNPNGAAGQKIKNYLLADPDAIAGLNPVSDYSRRAMALMSLSISPYDGVKTDYIKKITDSFDGQQFGDASLYNDDIFALLVLIRAGYGAEEEMIKEDVGFILEKQSANGAWNGVDLTAAAVQALKSLESLAGVSAALLKAKTFLAGAQGADGGFGNSFATTWAMQAIASLGEEPDEWRKNGLSPQSFLAAKQGEDGGLEKDDAYPDNRVWATAYALPAVQKKTWLEVMKSFAKPAEPVLLNELSGANNDQSTATSTGEIIEVASSSPAVLDLATTTAAEADAEKVIESVEPAAQENREPPSTLVAPAKAVAPKAFKRKISQAKPQVQGTAEVKRPEPISAPAVVVQPADNQAEEKQTVGTKISGLTKKTFSAITDTILAGIIFLLKLLVGLL